MNFEHSCSPWIIPYFRPLTSQVTERFWVLGPGPRAGKEAVSNVSRPCTQRTHRVEWESATNRQNYPSCCLVIQRTECLRDKYKMPFSCAMSPDKLCCAEAVKGGLTYNSSGSFFPVPSLRLFLFPKEKFPKWTNAYVWGGKESSRHWRCGDRTHIPEWTDTTVCVCVHHIHAHTYT